MTKKELIDKVAKDAKISKAAANKVKKVTARPVRKPSFVPLFSPATHIRSPILKSIAPPHSKLRQRLITV